MKIPHSKFWPFIHPTLILSMVLLLLSGCAKVSYLWDQGRGQLSLFWDGRENSEVLKDPNIPSEFKEKIRLVEKYKRYFYEHWNKKETDIYSETTILDQEAVTYLVIASPYDHIRPLKHSFPFMGEFPYLGFFSREKAYKYAQNLEEESNDEKEKWVTYVRPVYAYSTLGYFEDNILSSFFEYDDFALAELVFHELFHTIFFIKNEVGFNESLATFFSRKMTYEYFKLSDDEIEKKKKSYRDRDLLMRNMVTHVEVLNRKYQEAAPESKEEAKKLLDNYLSTEFLRDFKELCEQNKMDHCFPIQSQWNNASLAAMMTYQNKEKKLDQLFKAKKMDLKEFFNFIQKSYDQYLDSDEDGPFSNGLFQKNLKI
ncbi:MAG: hypothetical protein CME63_03345 [Halobacteriovoraceae bacterium]|nr:hypothetical protein [Halobacteriovoraceae bacterium]